MKINKSANIAIGAFGPSMCSDTFEFIFSEFIDSTNRNGLSTHFTLMMCTPYIDGTASIFSALDTYCRENNLTCFVILLTDQHAFSKTSTAINALESLKLNNIFGILFDANQRLYAHSKIYVGYQYHPNRDTINKLLKNKKEGVKLAICNLIIEGTQIDNLNSMYAPIFACFGSANLTAEAIGSKIQQEVIARVEDPELVEYFRKVFGQYIKNLPESFKISSFGF